MQELSKEQLKDYVSGQLRISSNGKRDLCPIYKNKSELDALIAYLIEPYRGKVDYVAAPEALGFILGSMIADALDVGFIPIRNGSVSYLEEEDAINASYIDHRDAVRSLHLRKSNFPEDSNILLVDDWVATAATMQACVTIIEEAKGHLVGIAAIGADYNAATAKMIDSGLLRSIL